jgi:hypothetical protein
MHTPIRPHSAHGGALSPPQLGSHGMPPPRRARTVVPHAGLMEKMLGDAGELLGGLFGGAEADDDGGTWVTYRGMCLCR